LPSTHKAIHPALKSSLVQFLSTVLPTPQETLLLRACLLPGELARQAWNDWKTGRDGAKTGSLERDESVKKLRLLLFRASQSHGFEIEKECRTYLRSAFLREELRNRIFHRICRDVLSLLDQESIPAIVLKGAALGYTVYDTPALRHCHDIEILVKEDNLGRVAELLQSQSFGSTAEGFTSGGQGGVLKHDSGLPLHIRSQLFELPVHNLAMSEFWARSLRQMIANVEASTLSPADNLFHICGHASYSKGCQSLHWITDAWFLIERYHDLDWDCLLYSARRHHLILPLSVMLGYLSESLGAPIPVSFLDSLHAAASRAGHKDNEAVLWGIVANGRVRSEFIIRSAAGWRERMSVIRWLLLPSPGYLRWGEHVRPTWLLPIYYLYRPLKFAMRRLRNGS
jgi:hypothetical protein